MAEENIKFCLIEVISLIFKWWSLFIIVVFQVDAHAEECFFDKVKTGTKMGLMFEVAEGGFLDIDVRIEGKTKNLAPHWT